MEPLTIISSLAAISLIITRSAVLKTNVGMIKFTFFLIKHFFAAYSMWTTSAPVFVADLQIWFFSILLLVGNITILLVTGLIRNRIDRKENKKHK